MQPRGGITKQGSNKSLPPHMHTHPHTHSVKGIKSTTLISSFIVLFYNCIHTRSASLSVHRFEASSWLLRIFQAVVAYGAANHFQCARNLRYYYIT